MGRNGLRSRRWTEQGAPRGKCPGMPTEPELAPESATGGAPDPVEAAVSPLEPEDEEDLSF